MPPWRIFTVWKNVRVVILYPKGKISLLQKNCSAPSAGNIETVAVDGDFRCLSGTG